MVPPPPPTLVELPRQNPNSSGAPVTEKSGFWTPGASASNWPATSALCVVVAQVPNAVGVRKAGP
ncbi:MAG: hypothetical protein IPH86_00055 [bacterium]|nr:hypothetical protein [bacterium]